MMNNSFTDSCLQHQIHLFEGYKERMLQHLYGEDYAEETLEIDVERYSLGSARRFSYDEGRKQAENDISLR
jgi:hypothetical protein